MFHQAVILAGGEGTRLRPVTYEIPKPLIPVQGKPILTWLVSWFFKAGVEEIILSVPPRWETAFGAWRQTMTDAGTIDVWVEPEPMGTLGALVHHLHDRFEDDPFFVTNGDELKGFDLSFLANNHQKMAVQHPQYAATIALVEVPNPSDYGVAELDGPLIARFHEKPAHPPSTLISSGLYVIEPSALTVADASKPFLMFEKDLFPQLALERRLGGCPLAGPWFDCGTMERWEKAIREWKGV